MRNNLDHDTMFYKIHVNSNNTKSTVHYIAVTARVMTKKTYFVKLELKSRSVGKNTPYIGP